ncbi:hypothetical protein [Bradyrhizobium symbiodeficiens]|uniref:hypothetical protein n=1 Tax=Bradyrhizobium symbiodeficiens TaxID=1404367 RepID=UPI0011E4D023|nr:hypothetical protein [Bradyrhizobium symbiodeficiens]
MQVYRGSKRSLKVNGIGCERKEYVRLGRVQNVEQLLNEELFAINCSFDGKQGPPSGGPCEISTFEPCFDSGGGGMVCRHVDAPRTTDSFIQIGVVRNQPNATNEELLPLFAHPRWRFYPLFLSVGVDALRCSEIL